MTGPRRGFEVVVTAAITISMVGLISGIEGTSGDVIPATVERSTSLPPTEARSYNDMRERDLGPNHGLPATWFARITRPPPIDAPVIQRDADRLATLDRRAARRAYDGAPPTIPHPVAQHASPPCLACHEHGARVANLTAPKMPHAAYENCLQCHVVERDPRSASSTPPAPETDFLGTRPRRGDRAALGTPPTIPHATTMRDRCDSCHGGFGSLGIRTTHPWRASCSQCHAPSAALDQRPGIGGLP
jgi:nitrate reductase (cytochrome), electron transfer subunit